MTKKGLLTRVGRGKYLFGDRKIFIPDIPELIINLNKKLYKQFPFLNICYWSTSFFNEFMIHQPGRFYYIIEVEKDAIEPVFYYLSENNYSVFQEPTSELISKYFPKQKDILIVKSLVTEAPVQKISEITTVTLEKMIVDIFCDPVIHIAQQGSEMETIFNDAFFKYAINISRLLRYAGRRGKKTEIGKFLEHLGIKY